MSIDIKDLPHYTYEDWILWEGKWELFAGHPVAMSPTAVPRHQLIAATLRSELYLALKSCNNCNAYDPLDYKVSEDTILVPDILVVCGKITKKLLDFTPSLVAEILSPSTALRDRSTKYEIYEQQGAKSIIWSSMLIKMKWRFTNYSMENIKSDQLINQLSDLNLMKIDVVLKLILKKSGNN